MKKMSNPLVLPWTAREGDSGGTHWQVHYMHAALFFVRLANFVAATKVF